MDKALARAARAGLIRRLGRGLYDDPRHDELGQALMPSTDAIVKAIKGRHAIRLQPSGAHAANLLGLSDQVPVRLVFLTDGLGRTVKVGSRHIVLRHASSRQMATAGRTSGTVIQALRWLGPDLVDATTVSRLRRRLPQVERQKLLRDARYAPEWIAEVMRKVAAGSNPDG